MNTSHFESNVLTATSAVTGMDILTWVAFAVFAVFVVTAIMYLTPGLFADISVSIKCLLNRFGAKSRIEMVVVACFIAGMVYAAGTKPTPPPVIVTKGINLTSVESDADGLRLSWEVEDDRIKDGDRFVVLARDRQIPARTGWGNWYEVTDTTSTSVELQGYFTRNRDVQFKIICDKPIEE